MAEELTKKQKEFADEYLETGNGTESALKAYDIANKDNDRGENTAAAIASKQLRKDKVREYLESKAEKASERIFELMNQDDNLPVALNASKDIMDRAGYKPVEKQEVLVEDNTQMSYERAKTIISGRKGSDQSNSTK